MTFALLFPGALAALAALGIPLLLHLARRAEQRPLDFAALRWIRSRHRPARRVVLEERRLLMLRLLLLGLVALFLAEPVVRPTPESRPWVVVVPGADPAEVQPLPEEAEWRWLAPGFPALGASVSAQQPVSSLLRELDALLPSSTPLVVIAPSVLHGLDGERVSLGRDVDWRTVPVTASVPAGTRMPAPRLALRHADERGAVAGYLRAVVAAWRLRDRDAVAPDVAAALRVPGPEIDTLFWLQPGNVPEAVREWTEAGRTLVVEPPAVLTDGPEETAVALWRAADGSVLATARPLGAGRLIRLQQPLRPDTLPQLLEPDFPAVLRALLQPGPAPVSAPAEAQRPLRSPVDSDGRSSLAARSLQPWLALLIALLLLRERWLATATRRWTA
ncbi:MAG: BatA domain-containing protein [Gammaproteobacteria bacterium]